MTRGRAKNAKNIQTPQAAKYYGQRASAGLIITEGTWVNPESVGFANVPGIFTDEQVEGWKIVTNAVHEQGGLIFLQLGHFGALAHPDYLNGELPLGPSTVKVNELVFSPTGPKPSVSPKEMTKADIERTVNDYKLAAQNAKKAGFDGVEIHAQGKSLISQFLSDTINKRQDEYGGSFEGKSRFLFQVLDQVLSVWGPKKVSIRLNPFLSYSNSLGEQEDMLATYEYVIKKLNDYDIAFLHVLDRAEEGTSAQEHKNRMIYQKMSSWYSGHIVANGGLTLEKANNLITEGLVSMASFGTKYIANPDLVYRFENNIDLSEGDHKTYYMGDDGGYIDYPSINQIQTK
jgi:N-ethylmaleimide reductase